MKVIRGGSKKKNNYKNEYGGYLSWGDESKLIGELLLGLQPPGFRLHQYEVKSSSSIVDEQVNCGGALPNRELL